MTLVQQVCHRLQETPRDSTSCIYTVWCDQIIKKDQKIVPWTPGLGKGGKASFFSVTDTPITNVSVFTYLGHDISNIYEKRCTDLLVSHATGEVFDLYRVLANKSMKKKTRRKLLESCVRSRLIYATQAILPKSREMTKI